MILNCKSRPCLHGIIVISTSVFHDITQSLEDLSPDMAKKVIGLKIQKDNLYDVFYTVNTLHNRNKDIKWCV